MIPPRRWNIFCVVVDNYGDAGVAWRLARELAVEHGLAVRLFCDRMPFVRSLSGTFVLAPALDGSRGQYDLFAIDFTDPDGEYAVSGSGSYTRAGTQPPSDDLKLEVAIHAAQGVQLASGAVKG